jgi:hypothetical protein
LIELTDRGRVVRDLWLAGVRLLTGASDYRVGRKFDATFNSAADFFASWPNIDPREFVLMQIRFVLDQNRPGILYPNVLLGDRALARYEQAPSREAAISQLRLLYLAQTQTFLSLLSRYGFNEALRSPVVHYTPIFMAHILFSGHLPLPDSLREAARMEAESRLGIEAIFSSSFLKAIGYVVRTAESAVV